MSSIETLLRRIEAGNPPAVILVGGNNDYLVEAAFDEIRAAMEKRFPALQVEAYDSGADLGTVVDSYRTHSLFSVPRLLIVPDVNAFVTKKEIKTLFDKALDDWSSAKTDRKRASSISKLLHTLGLIGADLEESDESIAAAVGLNKVSSELREMLATARSSGRRVSRGEGDAALLADAAAHGGAPGAVLLLRSGDIPSDSSTIRTIEKAGAIVECNLSREAFARAADQAIESVARDAAVKFDAPAIVALKRRLGIERMLADKFSKDVPDLRMVVAQAERLATLAGSGARVTASMVEDQVEEVSGGARYELGGLFTEGKILEAVEKLRELVAQARRDDPRTSLDIHYGKFLFPLADEVRQMLGILSFARLRKIDLRRPPTYNQFKDAWADALGDFLKEHGIVRQKPHPFPLYKKVEAAKRMNETALLEALSRLADLDFARKSGGVPAEVGIESFLLGARR
jgi:DNA polymerase III delta subunit